MAAHRAQLLLAILPNALSTGFAESDPDLEPLKVRGYQKDRVMCLILVVEEL